MKIQFDSSVRLAGIGLVPWTRLGPERWFTNYKIASLYGWDLNGTKDAPEVVALSDRVPELPHLPRLNTQSLLETPEFQKLIDESFQGYSFLTYKPVRVPAELTKQGHHFLSMDKSLTTTLENKVEFRTRFADLDLPFPNYTVVNRHDLVADDQTAKTLLDGRERIIVQDEQLSGGRGTYAVADAKSLAYALDSIEALGGGERMVISDMISDAHERSVQCVVTRYGTFVGHLQKQIIANPVLANLDVPDGDRFCGGEISAQDPLGHLYPKIRGYALEIGARLQQLGYRGIFSVDCLVDHDDNVFVLEVNPRLTGMTPLVTALYREGKDIPFYLLHMLEAAGMDYDITDDYVDPQPPEGSLLVLHSLQNTAVNILESPASGVYDVNSTKKLAKQSRLSVGEPNKQMLVQQYTPPGFKIKPGGRLMTLLLNGRVTDEEDRLLPDVDNAVQTLLRQVSLKEAK